MSPNPFVGLVHSRKFWLAILDTFISLALYFAGKYASPSLFEDVKFVIAALQPVFVSVILMIAYEDKAKAQLQADQEEAELYTREQELRLERVKLEQATKTETPVA